MARRQHAVVIGSGIGGLTAARVLADHADRVTVLDRDQFPAAPDHRGGVPQSHHVHGLQPRGAQAIYELFPELPAALAGDGAATVDSSSRVKIVTPAGLLPLDLEVVGGAMLYSRFLLEWRMRELLSRDRGVEFRAGVEVVGLEPGPVGDDGLPSVRGVRTRARGAGSSGERGATADHDLVEADLVVDASGRRSRLPEWLAELGYGAAHEETLDSELSYASRFYRRPAAFPDEFSLVIVNARPPSVPRAGLVQDVENGLWHVTLGGVDGTTVPTDEEGFLAYARELADPSVYEAIRVAEPVSPIRGWRTPTSRWRHFERMPAWPSGLIATGDSVCALNPIYGQGMTVAALESTVLAECLRTGGDRDGLERTVQRRLADTASGPWLVASSEDLRWPGTTMYGARPPRGMATMRRYLDTALRGAVHDSVLANLYWGLVGMTESPASFLRPRTVARVVRHAVSRAITPRDAVPALPRHALSPEGLATARALPTYRAPADTEPVAEPALAASRVG